MKVKLKLVFTFFITILLFAIVGVYSLAAGSNNLSYKVNGNTIFVDACDIDAEGVVVIPDTYNGKKVTGIAPSAFLGCEKITEIIIPETVNYIGASAFEGCLALTQVVIPDGVTSINAGTFRDCVELKKVMVPDSVKSIGVEAFCNAGYFLEITLPDSITQLSERCFFCSGVSKINIPKNVKVIPKEMFSGCGLLESLVIPDGVKEIGEEALGGGAYFSVINIPSSVTKIGKRAFLNLANLERITVDTDNPAYTSESGVLLSKDKKVLVSYPSSRENTSYVVPQTVVEISDFAFEWNCYVENITLPDSIKTIGFGAFSCCQELRKINLPNSLTQLPQSMFTRCYALNNVSIPDSITVIPDNLFYCCENLCDVELPTNLTAIGCDAFNGTKYCEDKSYWRDGCLYIDNYLIDVDRAYQGQLNVKKGTKVISDYAFSLCDSITTVIIPDGIKRIPYAAFLFCASLENVSLPASLEYIDAFAFSSASDDFQYITFRGTPEQWGNVKMDEIEAEYLKDLAVSCESFSAPLVEVSNTVKGVLITWSHHADIDGFVLYRSEKTNGGWKAWQRLGVKNPNTVSCCDTTAKSGVVYRYTIRLMKGDKLSAYKPSTSIMYLSQPTVEIANVEKGIKVSWSKTKGASHYIIYRSDFNNDSWGSWKRLAKISSSNTYWVDASALNSKKYKYTVVAEYGSSKSSYVKSNELIAITQPAVSYSNVSTGIKVSWSTVSSADGYRVYRATLTNGKWSGWKNMGTAAATKKSWVDGSVKSGQRYKYTVRAVNADCLSSYVNSSGLLYLAEPLVGVENGSRKITLKWTKSDGATGYRLYRSVYSNGKWSSWGNVGTLKSDRTSWVDKNIDSGLSYKYTVRAVNGKTLSSYTKTYNYYKLAKPDVKATNGLNGVNVSWSVVSGARSYNIYRSEYKNDKWSSWSKIKNVNSAKISWVDTKALSGKIYRYTVIALNENVKSSYKATNTLMKLDAPVFSCSGDGKKGITLKWNSIAGATEYYVYRKVDNATNWSRIASVKGTSYIDKMVNDDGKCTYTIRAKNGSNMSSYVKPGTTISLNLPMDVFRLVNEERRKAGLHELEYCYELQSVVDLRAEEIKECYAHTRPDGTLFYTAIGEAGISYYGSSENIARGITDPELVMYLWMNSPSHNANILDPFMTHMAVGYVDGRWVQIFVDLDGTLIFE